MLLEQKNSFRANFCKVNIIFPKKYIKWYFFHFDVWNSINGVPLSAYMKKNYLCK